MAQRIVTISSNGVYNPKPTMKNASTEKIVILPSRTILYGRTPTGIAKKTFASIASQTGLTSAEFATRVLSMNLAEKLQVLRDFYVQKLPDFRKVYDPLIAEESDSTSGDSQLSKRTQKPPNKKKRPPVKTTKIRKKGLAHDSERPLSLIPSPLVESVEEPRPPPDPFIRPYSDRGGQETQIPCDTHLNRTEKLPERPKMKRKTGENPFSFVQTQKFSDLNPTETELDSIFFTSTQPSCPKEANSSFEAQGSFAFDLDEIFFTQRKRPRADQSEKTRDSASVSLLQQVSTTKACQPTEKQSETLTLMKTNSLWEPVSPRRNIVPTVISNTPATIHERLVSDGKLVPNDKRRTF